MYTFGFLLGFVLILIVSFGIAISITIDKIENKVDRIDYKINEIKHEMWKNKQEKN